MKNIKIVSCYHKPDTLLTSDMVAPIHVGRAVASAENKYGLKEILGDNTGEHISELNPWYAELTALYWAWKNPEALGNPDHIGLMHYRRFFQAVNERYDSNDKSKFYKIFRKQYVRRPKKLRELIENSDIVCPRPYAFTQGSIGNNYAQTHIGKDFDETMQIAQELYPQYADTIKAFPNSNNAYLCNMTVMKKEVFNIYCEFMFSILEKLRQNRDLNTYEGYQTRVLGFMGERLTSLFINIQKEHNPDLVINETNVTYRDKEPESMTLQEITARYVWRHPGFMFKKKFWRALSERIKPKENLSLNQDCS